MQFIVNAYDGKDVEAPQRRTNARDQHLACAEKMYNEKKLLIAAAMMNEEEQMIGSIIVVDFPSEAVLREEWLDHEPYILENVWDTVEIIPCRVPGFCL